MKKSLIVWCLSAACAIPGLAANVDRQAALDAVVAAEKAFSKAAAEKGTRAAFLEVLAEDSVVFAPGPVPGRATWEGRPVRPSLLSWFPVVADVSLAGDLGYTTGPWELRPKGKDDKNVIHGFYTTFWRKQGDGSYKLLFDGGISSPAPPASATEVKIGKAVPATVEPPQVEESRGKFMILSADRAFAKAAASRGTAAAYADFLADDSRLHREGTLPVVSKAKILETLKAQAPKMVWAPIQARIATSGDLGYSVGNETIGGEQGFYLRIWKKQADASWRVVLDLYTPAPPEEKPSGMSGKPPGHPS